MLPLRQPNRSSLLATVNDEAEAEAAAAGAVVRVILGRCSAVNIAVAAAAAVAPTIAGPAPSGVFPL